MKRLTMIVCLTLAIAVIPACELTPEQKAAVNTALDQSGPVIEQLEDNIAASKERLATIENEEDRAKAAKALAESEKVLAEVKSLREIGLANRDAEGNIDMVGAGGDVAAKVASRLIPSPWGEIAGLVVGGVVMGIRSHQNKKRAIAIVRAFDEAKKHNTALAEAMKDPATARILDKMGDGAKHLVDIAQGKTARLPVIPV